MMQKLHDDDVENDDDRATMVMLVIKMLKMMIRIHICSSPSVEEEVAHSQACSCRYWPPSARLVPAWNPGCSNMPHCHSSRGRGERMQRALKRGYVVQQDPGTECNRRGKEVVPGARTVDRPVDKHVKLDHISGHMLCSLTVAATRAAQWTCAETPAQAQRLQPAVNGAKRLLSCKMDEGRPAALSSGPCSSSPAAECWLPTVAALQRVARPRDGPLPIPLDGDGERRADPRRRLPDAQFALRRDPESATGALAVAGGALGAVVDTHVQSDASASCSSRSCQFWRDPSGEPHLAGSEGSAPLRERHAATAGGAATASDAPVSRTALGPSCRVGRTNRARRRRANFFFKSRAAAVVGEGGDDALTQDLKHLLAVLQEGPAPVPATSSVCGVPPPLMIFHELPVVVYAALSPWHSLLEAQNCFVALTVRGLDGGFAGDPWMSGGCVPPWLVGSATDEGNPVPPTCPPSSWAAPCWSSAPDVCRTPVLPPSAIENDAVVDEQSNITRGLLEITEDPGRLGCEVAEVAFCTSSQLEALQREWSASCLESSAALPRSFRGSCSAAFDVLRTRAAGPQTMPPYVAEHPARGPGLEMWYAKPTRGCLADESDDEWPISLAHSSWSPVP